MIIIFGKSNSGKTTVANKLATKGYKRIVTYTTRPKRQKEKNGVDYHFISEEDFKEKIQNGFFVEWRTYKTLQDGMEKTWYYGTSFADIKNGEKRSVIILTPDACKKIKDNYLQNIKMIYIYANTSTLKARSKNRGDDSKEAERRLNADVLDFRGAENIADKILYNNLGQDINEIVNKIITYVEDE